MRVFGWQQKYRITSALQDTDQRLGLLLGKKCDDLHSYTSSRLTISCKRNPTHTRLPHGYLRSDNRGKPDVSGTFADVNHELVIGDGKFESVGSVE